MLAKNSSRVTAESSFDHFGTKEFSDMSLWTTGAPNDIRSLKRCNSFLVSCNSA
jgi:hypothetical protein